MKCVRQVVIMTTVCVLVWKSRMKTFVCVCVPWNKNNMRVLLILCENEEKQDVKTYPALLRNVYKMNELEMYKEAFY